MRFRAWLLAAVLAGAAAVSPALSFDGPGCGGAWPPPPFPEPGHDVLNPCTFRVVGAPIVVSGTTIAGANQNSSVRVWMSPQGRPEISLLACSASGKGSLSCSRGLIDETTRTPIPPQAYWSYMFPLQCNVEVSPKGTFFCQTGTSAPWPCSPLPGCIVDP